MPEPAKSIKSNPLIRKQSTTRLSFSPTKEVKELVATQKTNQKIVLSFYGHKIDMPFKLTGTSESIHITTYLADLKTEYELIDSYKIEITHPLGVSYFRLDIPKERVASQISGDAFALAELNMKAKREFEDYLIQRKQYDLEFSTMDLSHRQARLGRKYEYISKGIDVAMGGIGFIASATTLGMTSANFLKGSMEATEKLLEQTKAEMFGKHYGKSWNAKIPVDPRSNFTYMIKVPRVPISQKGRGIIGASAVGAFSSASKLASGIVGLASASERAALQEEGFGIQIREKALESYRIDLGFEREKEEQLFTMRRLFANQTYNDVTNRQRQKALDVYETPKVEDIYLELWTTSGLQDQYVRDYHDKHGVDCRVVLNQFDTALKIHDEIRVGIYCIEDVVIENLADRVELEFLKARLTGGIRFVEWVEHERVKELTPVDKRILELQRELTEVQLDRQEKEQICQDTITRLSKNTEELNHQLTEGRARYHELSESYREKEEKLSEQQKLVGLYRDEVTHLKQDLLKESSQHATEKEGHSGTKEELEQKKGEVASLTQQVDNQLQQIQRKDQRIQTLQQSNQTLKQENSRVKANNQKLLKERDEALQQLRGTGLQPEVDRLTEEVRQKETELAEIKQKNREHEASLAGLHEIVSAKDQQIQKLEAEKGNPYLEWLGKIDPQAKFVIRKSFDYEIIQLSNMVKAFIPMPSKQEGVKIRIWTYPSYQVFTVGGENGSNKLRVKSSTWDGWINYFNEIQTTYQQLIDRNVINFGNISGQQILFYLGENVIPYFKVTQYTMTSGDNSGSKRYISLENEPIFWNEKERVFSYSAMDADGIKLKQINNYKEYKELFGIVISLKGKKVIDFETKEDYNHWKETEGEGAQEKDVTKEYS